MQLIPFIQIYRLIYNILKILAVFVRPFLPLKLKKWIELRNSQEYLNCKLKNSIWFHASSGEIEYCKSVIREIKKKHPNQPIIVSYSSPSAVKLIQSLKNDVECFFPLPWDTLKLSQNLMDHLKPRALIFSRTDLWPELITQAKLYHIPLMVISMYSKLNFLNRFTLSWLLTQFTLISTVNKKFSEELKNLSDQDVLFHSDTRFDQAFFRLQQASRIPTFIKNKKIVFASTWPEDDTVILPVIDDLIKKNLFDQIIICPHETHRSPFYKNYFQNSKPLLLSQELFNPSIKNSKLLIIDQVGYLADIYRQTEFAFVGGSFRKKIHSVLEPLLANNIIFFGPQFQNNPEAVETELQRLTFCLKTSTEMIQFIENIKTEEKLELKIKINKYNQSQLGSTAYIVQEIMKKLDTDQKDKI